jgi:hypothetical protein
MKLVVAPSIVLSLSLLVHASACTDAGKAPPQPGEAKTDADAKAGADAKTGADAKAGSVAEVVADAKVADAKAGPDATADADAKAVADPDAKAKAGVELSALYWAEAVEGKSSIDLIDLGEGEEVMALAEAHEHPDGISATLPATAELPAGFAVGDEWVVATATGERHGKAVAFGAMGGASEVHFIVVLDTAAEGLAARAGAWKGPIPTLRDAKPVVMTKGSGKALLGSIEAGILAAADPDAKAALSRKPIAAKHLTAVEGRFPGGFTHLVAMARPLAPENDIGSEHVAALLLVDATGRVEAIDAPHLSIDRAEVAHLVDLEGDGVDEVIYDSSYYEGSYRLLLTWDAAGKAVRRTLGGDGA